jgi:hypothetical protein
MFRRFSPHGGPTTSLPAALEDIIAVADAEGRVGVVAAATAAGEEGKC